MTLNTIRCKVCGKDFQKGGWKAARCLCSEACQDMWNVFGNYAKHYYEAHKAVTRCLKEQLYGLEAGSSKKTEAA